MLAPLPGRSPQNPDYDFLKSAEGRGLSPAAERTIPGVSDQKLGLGPPAPPSEIRRLPVAALGAVAVYCGLIAGTHIWGEALVRSGVRIGLKAPPLFGAFEPRPGPAILPAILVGVLVVAYGPRLAEKLPWRGLLGATFLGAAIWAVTLAASDGWAALTAPVLYRHDALAVLPAIDSGAEFLRTFIDRIAEYPIHVQGHPPGLPLLLLAMQGVGLASPGVIAALYIGAGSAIAPALLVATRGVAGETPARRAAPFLVLAPYAVWIATSADALYAGLAAWGIALLLSAPPQERPRLRPLTGGLLFGSALMLTYGAAALGAIAGPAALLRRRYRDLAWWAGGVAAVIAPFLLFGFWWLDGLAATRVRYYAGLGGVRPYHYFLVANLAALAIACGPAAIRGLVNVRHRLRDPQALLVAGALLAMLAANFSGLSKGEVERIWLLFAPWIVLAAGYLAPGRFARVWLGAGAASAVAVQVLVNSPW